MSYAYATRCDLDAATRTRDEPVRDRLSTPTRRWLRSALVYPSTEVDSCGHATLASAHLLWESGLLKQSEAARFHTRSGLLTAEQNRNLIELNFPALVEVPATAPVALTTALSVTPTYVGRFGERYLLEATDEDIVRDLNPDLHALRALPGRGVVVTRRVSASAYDFVSRYFAPWVGIDENPVITGSVHCCFGPSWGKRLGKSQLKAYQASARSGVVYIHLRDNQVYLGGYAVTIFRGELLQTKQRPHPY